MLSIEAYKRKYAYGEDYGTGYFKFGPIAEKPDVELNAGIVLDRRSSIMYKIFGIEKDVIVGFKVKRYFGSREELSRQMVYPMRDGIVKAEDERSWRILYELTLEGLEKHRPADKDFKGFYVVAAISSIAIVQAPEMYRKILAMHRKIDEETGLVKAVTVIPQPLAVAIAEKRITCIVIESGHGNTQICPISEMPIREAILPLNRGGEEADFMTAEILKDAGYGDIAREEYAVREIKEAIGLIPRDLDESIKKAKEDWEKYRVTLRKGIVEIDLGKESWKRFLIGEIIFNPQHEIFESYYRRGMPRPRSSVFGEDVIDGTISLAEAIEKSLRKLPLALQDTILEEGGIILSGGNFAWKVPKGFEDVAVNSAEKLRIDLAKRGIHFSKEAIGLVKDPQYSVWKGCIVYAVAVPDDYLWSEEQLEGWYKWR